MIEEPVNILEEEQQQHQATPSPSISYNLDEVSIPSPLIITPSGTPPVIATPPVLAAPSVIVEEIIADKESRVSTPLPADVALPTEPLPLATISGSSSPATSVTSAVLRNVVPASPASIGGGRRDSIRSVTFSSSRSPSPAYSNPLSMASSAQEIASAPSPSVSATYSEQEETSSQASAADAELKIGTPEPTEPLLAAPSASTSSAAVARQELVLQIPVSEVDHSILPKTFSTTKTATARAAPTALFNKIRAPTGNVNLKRSLEICQTAVQKSATAVVQQQPHGGALPTVVVTTASQLPAGVIPITVRPQTVQSRPTTMAGAVLMTTSDGKTILAHPANQLIRQIRPVTSLATPLGTSQQPIRIRLPQQVGGHQPHSTLKIEAVQPTAAPGVGGAVAIVQPAPGATAGQPPRPGVQQVCLLPARASPGLATNQRPVFRMPTATTMASATSAGTVVLDAAQLGTLLVRVWFFLL